MTISHSGKNNDNITVGEKNDNITEYCHVFSSVNIVIFFLPCRGRKFSSRKKMSYYHFFFPILFSNIVLIPCIDDPKEKNDSSLFSTEISKWNIVIFFSAETQMSYCHFFSRSTRTVYTNNYSVHCSGGTGS